MAEQIFASMSEYGMSLSTITGASGSLGNLKIAGQQMAVSPPPRVIEYNYVNQLVYNGVDHSRRRGLTLATFNQDMTLTYLATFDIYSDVNALLTLSNRLMDIKDTEIMVLASYDAINSSVDLDNTFKHLGSAVWPGREFFNKSTNHKRSSYAAIVCGKKRNVVAEKLVGYNMPQPQAIIEISFSDPLSIGNSGFGEPIITDLDLRGSSGNKELVYSWANKKTLTELGIKVGDSFLVCSQGEIDAIAAAAGVWLDYDVVYYNSSNGIIRTKSTSIKSVEGWEQVAIRDTIPTGCVYITIQATKKSSGGGALVGTVYAKNTVMQRSDNTTSRSNTVSFGVYGTSLKSYDDSLGSFGQYNPESYFQAYISESNLLRNTPMPQVASEPIRWMDRVLDDDNYRSVVSTISDTSLDLVNVPLDPTKWYYFCVWVNKQEKESGEFKLGFVSYDNTNTVLDVHSTDRETTDKQLYSQMPPFDTLETRQWYLLQGFLLPHNVDQNRADTFIDQNKDFYGWDDLYGNGIGVSDEGTGMYGWINNPNCTKGSMVLVDADNQAKQSKSLWALPIIKELTIGSIDIDDGMLTSISLTG